MKLRDWLKKLRLRPLNGEGQQPIDTVDADAVDAWSMGYGKPPTNWVPSQQDEEPRH